MTETFASDVSRPTPQQYVPRAERRLIRLDFRDKVQGIWDESIPIIRQWVVEGVGIHDQILSSETSLRSGADKLCAVLELTVVDTNFQQFGPGATLVYVLSESHLAIHSWPERRYLHADLVTWRKSKVDIGELSDAFALAFSPSNIRAFSVKY